MERILCAAIWYIELETKFIRPKNIDKGIVVCGYRHSDCIAIMAGLATLRSVTFGPNCAGEDEQGFLTSKNRFVSREEAAEIAWKANQTASKLNILYSEDLY